MHLRFEGQQEDGRLEGARAPVGSAWTRAPLASIDRLMHVC